MKTNGYKPELSLIIPCFNEAENTELLVARLSELRNQISVSFEVLFIDGGSTDSTPELLQKALSHNDMQDIATVFVLPNKCGYGHDIVYGLGQARADVLAWTHADMQTDVYDVFRAYDLLNEASQKSEKLIIKGRRLKRPLFDRLFTFGMQLFSLITLKANLVDINAQPKVFHRSFFEEHLEKGSPDDFSLDLFALYMAKLHDYRIQTIPVLFNARLFGDAKGGGGALKLKFSLTLRTIKFILKLRRRISEPYD